MATLNIGITTDDDQQFIALVMHGDKGQIGEIRIDAYGAGEMIRRLAFSRRTLLGTLPTEPKPEEILPGPTDPVWRVPDRASNEPVVLDVRHPTLGWLRFAFDPRKAGELAAALTRPTQS